jgi:3-phenylpropionate/trans-cinnamate dioxygenase ferredoxin reductase component
MHVIIIGNGIAGITAARTIRKLSEHKITVISSESEYFFSRTALMYVYMGHMRWTDIEPYESWFWKKNKIDLLFDHVTGLDSQNKKVQTSGGQLLPYDKLIIATGSSSNRLNIEGENLEGVKALYAKQDLEYLQANSKSIRRAVVIGGGLIGIELTEMLHSRNIPVTFLIRESGFSDMVLPPEESEMVNRIIRQHGIDLRLETEVASLRSDNNGRICAVQTSVGEEIPCDFAGITIGVQPNVDWLRNTGLEINKGILVDHYLKTNLDHIYAIGDCAELRFPAPDRRAIEPLWYIGRLMGETVAYTLCGLETTYNAGIWFNSAKFFEMEYQVYGDIKTPLPKEHKTIFWQHPDGLKSIRINYTDGGVAGFNLMGIRFRHEVCEKWIQTKTSITEVLSNLELACFEPEFSKTHSFDVRDVYYKLTGQRIQPASKKGYNPVCSFLKNIQSSLI